MKRIFLGLVFALVAVPAFSQPAGKTVRIVVGFPPGARPT